MRFTKVIGIYRYGFRTPSRDEAAGETPIEGTQNAHPPLYVVQLEMHSTADLRSVRETILE